MEVLKGKLGNEPIDLFLDSGTRRILAGNPERSVVLVLTRLECGEGTWTRIGLADDEFGPAVRSILDAEGTWSADPTLRPAFFSKWLGHPNRQMRTLAHIEVARAPYREILGYSDALSREEIHRFLANVRYLEWHPLYILLLAGKDHPEDHEVIRRSFFSNARFGTVKTQEAWTAAYLEIAESEAIEAI